MPSARAPSMSSAYESPTITVSAAATPSAASAVSKIDGVRLRPAVALRADGDVDVELVVARERLEVALPVRDQPDPEPVRPERLEHGHGVVVEVEVGVDLPATDDLDGAGARAVGVAAHAADDVLGERDPDLLVVHELRVHPQVVERREPRRPRSGPGRG